MNLLEEAVPYLFCFFNRKFTLYRILAILGIFFISRCTSCTVTKTTSYVFILEVFCFLKPKILFETYTGVLARWRIMAVVD